MLVLSTLPGACSLADHIALAWSGLPYQIKVMTREVIKSADYLAKNPMGQVPLLEDGDWYLTQNAAILTYIAEKAPQANIGAQNTPESHAKMASWLSYISADFHPAFGMIFGAARFGLDEATTAELKQAAIHRVRKVHLGPMNDYMAIHQFIFDHRKTVVDAYFWVVISWAVRTIPEFASDYPHLQAYFDRLQQDPGIRQALQEQSA